MRDQYAGDVNDFLKFAFLLVLAGKDRTLGVAWYYNPGDDGRADGRHLEWREESAWQGLDRELHAGLSMLPERSVAALEKMPIWPKDTLFHRDPVPTKLTRDAWVRQMVTAMESADLLFLDPDNGLGGASAKHATFSEIRLLQKQGRAIVFITFPGRNMSHNALVIRLHDQLKAETGAGSVITLRSTVRVPCAEGSHSRVPRQCWFTVINPDPELIARAQSFAYALSSVPQVRAKLDGVPYAGSRDSGTISRQFQPFP